MPVTIRQGTVNFKDSSNEYVPINAVAQQTSEAEIAAIQSLSNTEKSAIQSLSTTEQAAIQAKGTETLASIPNDYTDLSDEVDELKSAVITTTGNTRIEYTVDNAYYNTSTVGSTVSSTTASNNFEAAMLNCSQGDVFTIIGQGGSNGRLWAFLDGDSKVIERETSTSAIAGKVIVAPASAAKLVINNHKVNRPNDYSYYGDIIRLSAMVGNGEFAHASASPIADADNAEPNKIYSIPTLTGTSHIPACGNLVTFAYGRNATMNKSQFLMQCGTTKRGLYYRAKWNTTDAWTDWMKFGENWVFTVGPGGCDFTLLIQAIAEAVKHENSVVIVKAGKTYNIIDDMNAVYGSGYMDSHTFTASDRGPELYNGIHLIFESGAKVTCNYTGENATANEFFSPLNVSGSCEVENLDLTASNVRYAIHAENGGNNTPYKEIWRRCRIEFDNSQNPNWHTRKCIGGGLGKHADVLIEGCYFNPKNIDSAGISAGCVTYHNNTSAGSQSNVVIRDCYFEKSTFSIRWYGSSELMTTCICTNNSVTTAPTCYAENSSATNENVVMYAWNNEIRES